MKSLPRTEWKECPNCDNSGYENEQWIVVCSFCRLRSDSIYNQSKLSSSEEEKRLCITAIESTEALCEKRDEHWREHIRNLFQGLDSYDIMWFEKLLAGPIGQVLKIAVPLIRGKCKWIKYPNERIVWGPGCKPATHQFAQENYGNFCQFCGGEIELG